MAAVILLHANSRLVENKENGGTSIDAEKTQRRGKDKAQIRMFFGVNKRINHANARFLIDKISLVCYTNIVLYTII